MGIGTGHGLYIRQATENYDITTLLEKVAYFVKENEEKNSSNT